MQTATIVVATLYRVKAAEQSFADKSFVSDVPAVILYPSTIVDVMPRIAIDMLVTSKRGIDLRRHMMRHQYTESCAVKNNWSAFFSSMENP